jgi:hypothetical protein
VTIGLSITVESLCYLYLVLVKYTMFHALRKILMVFKTYVPLGNSVNNVFKLSPVEL